MGLTSRRGGEMQDHRHEATLKASIDLAKTVVSDLRVRVDLTPRDLSRASDQIFGAERLAWRLGAGEAMALLEKIGDQLNAIAARPNGIQTQIEAIHAAILEMEGRP